MNEQIIKALRMLHSTDPYRKAAAREVRKLERDKTQAGERTLFLLLFYRERISRLAGRLQSQHDSREVARQKRQKYVFSQYDLEIRDVSAFLADIVQRAEDETRCNDICKSMYFCDLKKGHKGKHKEIIGSGGLVW